MAFSDHLKPLPRKNDLPLLAGILLWLFGLVSNGFILFLWVVFGLAAAGNAGADAKSFLTGSLAAAGVAVALSLCFVFAGRFVIAFASTFLVMPFVVICLTLVMS